MNDKQYIDKLAYVYLKDKKILVTLSKGKDTWYVPGGKRKESETDEQALSREINEELTVNLISNTIKYYGTFEAQAHGKPDGTMVRITCYTGEFDGTLQPSAEIAEIDFFEYSQKSRTSKVDFLLFDDLLKKGLIN